MERKKYQKNRSHDQRLEQAARPASEPRDPIEEEQWNADLAAADQFGQADPDINRAELQIKPKEGETEMAKEDKDLANPLEFVSATRKAFQASHSRCLNKPTAGRTCKVVREVDATLGDLEAMLSASELDESLEAAPTAPAPLPPETPTPQLATAPPPATPATPPMPAAPPKPAAPPTPPASRPRRTATAPQPPYFWTEADDEALDRAWGSNTVCPCERPTGRRHGSAPVPAPRQPEPPALADELAEADPPADQED